MRPSQKVLVDVSLSLSKATPLRKSGFDRLNLTYTRLLRQPHFFLEFVCDYAALRTRSILFNSFCLAISITPSLSSKRITK